MSDKSVFAKLKKLQEVPLQQICQALAEEGKEEVDSAYSSASSPGNTAWNTEIREIPNGASLIAYGDDVPFLEFGTGITTTPDEFASVVDYPVAPGTWSETHEKQFSTKGYWRFEWDGVLSERITGTPATRGMQRALDRMREGKAAFEEIQRWINGS